MDNHFYAITSDGESAWEFDTRDWVISSPAIGGDGTVYVGAYNQSVYAFSADGELLWKHKTDKYISSSPQISEEGVLYIGSDDNYIYAIVLDHAGLFDSAWPRFRGDFENSGFVQVGD